VVYNLRLLQVKKQVQLFTIAFEYDRMRAMTSEEADKML
jgi:hypothetical protein